MIEDKLPPEQRLRLECLNQAVSKANMTPRTNSAESILDDARKFESWIKGTAENE